MFAPRQAQHNGHLEWLVDARPAGKGRRYFKTESDARIFAAELLLETTRHGTATAADFSAHERNELLALRARLAAAGASFHHAVDAYLGAPTIRAPKPILDATIECIKAKEASGRKRRTIQQLTYSLQSFAVHCQSGAFCDTVTAADIEAWLNNPKWSPETRKHRLIDVGTFFSFAVRRGWCVANPALQVERITTDDRPPGILTPGQASKLMEAARSVAPRSVPYFALGLFAGVRPSEIQQLTWQQIDFQSGYCEIPAALAKGRRRRLIQLQPNALAWLKLGGELPPIGWQDDWDRVRKASGLFKRWPHDAMRHSFCSYALCVFGEVSTTQWAGHSAAILFSRYRELVKRADADRFWGIVPA